MSGFLTTFNNHPSIICWVPFNESWGIRNVFDHPDQQMFAKSVYALIKTADPSRLVSTNDGWEQVDSDLCSIHDYAANADVLSHKWDNLGALLDSCAQKRWIYAMNHSYKGQPVILSEFGGIAYKTNQNDWDWGYDKTEQSEGDFLLRLSGLVSYIRAHPGIQGYCYTQFADVMQEVNGLVDAFRTPKSAIEKYREIFGD